MAASPMPEDQANQRPNAPDEHLPVGPGALPDVKPPSPGFLVQLFVIPMIIVTIIVLVWFLFSWLAHLGSNPRRLLTDLERLNQGSWQDALTLANLLRDPGNGALRQDAELAGRLAQLLHDQLSVEDASREQAMLRMYLSRALGYFEVPDVLPALLQAASQERAPQDLPVRRAALQSLGLIADRQQLDDPAAVSDLIDVVRSAATSHSDDPRQMELRGQLRATANYTLGLISDPRARDQLESSLSDPYPDARYNAATGLARQGDARAVPRLLEMLDPNNDDAVRFEQKSPTARQWKRNLVLQNALRAVRMLVAANPHVPRATLLRAVQRLCDDESLDGAVGVEASQTLQVLQSARPTAAVRAPATPSRQRRVATAV